MKNAVIGYYETREEAEAVLKTVEGYSYGKLKEVCPLSEPIRRRHGIGTIRITGRRRLVQIGSFKTKEEVEIVLESMKIATDDEIKQLKSEFAKRVTKENLGDDKYQKIIAGNIKKHRVRSGMSQSELSKIMRFNGKALIICAYETGRLNITLEKIEKFAEALKTTPAGLLEEPKRENAKADPKLTPEQQKEFAVLETIVTEFLNIKS